MASVRIQNAVSNWPERNLIKEILQNIQKNGGDKMSKLLYLDNAATTKTAPEVVEAMLPYFTELYGNPSSVYSFSQKSKEAITAGRENTAA